MHPLTAKSSSHNNYKFHQDFYKKNCFETLIVLYWSSNAQAQTTQRNTFRVLSWASMYLQQASHYQPTASLLHKFGHNVNAICFTHNLDDDTYELQLQRCPIWMQQKAGISHRSLTKKTSESRVLPERAGIMQAAVGVEMCRCCGFWSGRALGMHFSCLPLWSNALRHVAAFWRAATWCAICWPPVQFRMKLGWVDEWNCPMRLDGWGLEG